MIKAQATLEMIISVGFLLLIFTIVVMMALDKSTQSSELKTFLDAKRIGESIRDNVNMISQQGPGYYKYFSVPLQLHGGYDYNITINGSVMELSWADKAWATQLMNADTRIYSLDKGTLKRNKVLNDGGIIEISGHRPNLLPDCSSVAVSSDPTMMNVTFDVINDAHVGTNTTITAAFRQICGGVYETPFFATAPEIDAFSKIEVMLNYTIQCAVNSTQNKINIKVDYDAVIPEGIVMEGIESDNECNATIA